MTSRRIIRTQGRSNLKFGGMEVQFGAVSTGGLHMAQKDPLEYKDLIVRIAGFSSCFIPLDEALPDDFIPRTEQNI